MQTDSDGAMKHAHNLIYKKTIKPCFKDKKLISFYRIDNSNVCFCISGTVYDKGTMVLDSFQRIENYKINMKDLLEESKKDIYLQSNKKELNSAMKYLFQTEWCY